MTKHAHYMTERPFSIGAQPKEGLVEAEDFDGKKYVEDYCGGFARWFDVDAVVDELVAMDVCDIDEMDSDEFTEVLERRERKGK